VPLLLEILWSVLFGIGIASAILLLYFILRRKFNSYDSGAIAAAYGSVVSYFVTAASF
jgi:hypothetical protein